MDDLRFYALLSIFFTYIRTLEECAMDPCLSLVKFPPPELRDSGLEKKIIQRMYLCMVLFFFLLIFVVHTEAPRKIDFASNINSLITFCSKD